MRKQLYLLTSIWFLLGLTLLLANDFYLKAQFGNAFTGKLSDVAGLFIFPLFWTALAPKWKKLIFGSTALLFIWWKSPFSEAFINSWNALDLIPIARVVDYSDLWALAVLPVAYWLESSKTFHWKVRLHPILPLVVAAFAFVATSLPYTQVPVGNSYTFFFPKDTLVNRLARIPAALAWEEYFQNGDYPDTLHLDIYSNHCFSTVFAIVELIDQSPEQSQLQLLSFEHKCGKEKEDNTQAMIEEFEAQVIEPLRNPLPVPHRALNFTVPTEGNSWVLDEGTGKWNSYQYTSSEEYWYSRAQKLRTWFYVQQAGTYSIGIRASVPEGSSNIQVKYGDQNEVIRLEPSSAKVWFIDDWTISEPGYQAVDVTGLAREGEVFAVVEAVLIGADPGAVNCVQEDFYFGKRGPSVHLWHEVPKNAAAVRWFYSELEIEKGQDVIGSYFMANGFDQGYFGIQVNSPEERRILFSVWSPYQTDDPGSIPEEYKIKMLNKGQDVYTGEFGNEGAGGQSYLRFDWKPNTRYGFLIGAQPTGDGATDFTAYFYDPKKRDWLLIARFRRPKTDTYLTGLYSFLENFMPDTGPVSRRGGYYNQWIYDTGGQWHELTRATFTADNTARKGDRLDYSGGSDGEGYFLQNCGFTNQRTEIDSRFTREGSRRAPSIDFKKLGQF